MKWIRIIKRDLLALGFLATSSVCAGIFANQFREKPLPLVYASKAERMDKAVSKLAVTVSESDHPQVFSLAEFREFVESKNGLVLDARPEIFHRLGHVPGALSLSREEFEKDYAKHRATLDSYKNRPIAVYCSNGGCEDSRIVADALIKLGCRKVFLFKGGWAEWTREALPEERL